MSDGDDVSLDADGTTGRFASPDVGTAIGITITGLTLSGDQAADYALTPPTTTANINQATLTVTGITAIDRNYDGTTAVQLDTSAAVLNGVIGTDDVTLETSDAKGELRLCGRGQRDRRDDRRPHPRQGQASDYALTPPTTTANINQASLTVSGVTAFDKVYDGTTDATLDASGAALVGRDRRRRRHPRRRRRHRHLRIPGRGHGDRRDGRRPRPLG